MRKTKDGPLALEFGRPVAFVGAGRSETGFKSQLKAIARSQKLMRKFEETLDHASITAAEKRRVILAMKRLAGTDNMGDSDLAPLTEMLRGLAAETRQSLRLR